MADASRPNFKAKFAEAEGKLKALGDKARETVEQRIAREFGVNLGGLSGLDALVYLLAGILAAENTPKK